MFKVGLKSMKELSEESIKSKGKDLQRQKGKASHHYFAMPA